MGVVQGVQTRTVTGKSQLLQEAKAERALETGTRLLNSSRVSQERESPWAKRLTAGLRIFSPFFSGFTVNK